MTYGENTLRIAVMVLPFLMPLEVETVAQRRGVRLCVVGDDRLLPVVGAVDDRAPFSVNGWPERGGATPASASRDRAGDTVVPGLNRFNGMAAAIAW